MILPKVRDPRLITIRRGGTLTDADHRRLALWAAACAEHVLHLFEDEQGWDPVAGRTERDWQRRQLDSWIRSLVIEDQAQRDAICWSAVTD